MQSRLLEQPAPSEFTSNWMVDDLLLEASGPPPDAVLDALSQHKAEVVRILHSAKDGCSLEYWHVLFHQRVAFAEYAGGLPCAEAEARAKSGTQPQAAKEAPLQIKLPSSIEETQLLLKNKEQDISDDQAALVSLNTELANLSDEPRKAKQKEIEIVAAELDRARNELKALQAHLVELRKPPPSDSQAAPPPPPPSCGRASFTTNARPRKSFPFNASIAFTASASLAISANPKPRG